MEQTDTREILWANVEALMTTAYGKERLSKFAEETGIGNATMTRIKAKSSYPNSETLERIAEKFSLEPWQLLAPNLGRDADAAAPPNTPLDGGGQSPQSGPTTVNEPLVTYNIDAEQYMTEQDLMKLVRMVRPEDRKKAAAAIGPLLAGYRAELDSLLGQIDAEPENNRPFLRPRSGGG